MKADPRTWSVYLVTDRALAGQRSLSDLVRAAIAGGVSVVQLREKHCTSREFFELAQEVRAITREAGIPLIINDRVDIASAVGADGVHLGQEDLPVAAARKVLGPHAVIGLSVERMEDVEEAEALDVDYYGVSPVFLTPTKAELTRAWGLEGLRAVRDRTRRPLIAIGGISASNAGDVIEAGADGVAVVSAICAAPDPQAATREILDRVLEARSRR